MHKKLGTAAMAAAAMFCTNFFFNANAGAAVTANANFNATVETTGAFGTTGSSFQAAGNAANTNTPSDTFPAFGTVAFNASSYASLASSGVTSSATLSANEFTSTSSSIGTHAGSVLNIYFAEAPTTTTAGLGDYDVNNEPGGFDAGNFSADLVGTVTYANVNNQLDSIPLTLSSADVSYIDGVLAGGPGTFELFTVATTGTVSARYDGTFASSPATLTLNGVPEPTSLGVIGLGCVALLGRRRRV